MNGMEKKIRVTFLSDGESAVYDFMRRYLAENSGVPPTVRDIAAGCGVSSTTAWYRLRGVEALGLAVPVKRNGRTYYTVAELAECAKGLNE